MKHSNYCERRSVAVTGYSARLMLILGLFVCSFSAMGAEAVAMVTDLQGKVTVSAGGKQHPGEILAYLKPGEELLLAEGAGLTLVYFQSGKEHLYSGPVQIRLEAEQPLLLSGSEGKSRDLAIVKETGLKPARNRGYAQAAIVLRGTGKKKKIRLLGPKNTKVLQTQPLFRWQPLAANLQYRFVLSDDSGQSIIETLVNDTTFRVPHELRLQDDAWYTWQVETRLASGKVFSSSADFSLLAQTERSKVMGLQPAESVPFAERVLFASVLEQMGLHEEARLWWTKLAVERPDAEAIKARVAR